MSSKIRNLKIYSLLINTKSFQSTNITLSARKQTSRKISRRKLFSQTHTLSHHVKFFSLFSLSLHSIRQSKNSLSLSLRNFSSSCYPKSTQLITINNWLLLSLSVNSFIITSSIIPHHINSKCQIINYY